jgi:hypothetical protein
MPLPAGPDRTKGKIAGMILQRINPTNADIMRSGTEKNLKSMQRAEPDGDEKESEVAGSMALRAFYSALQSSDFVAAYQAYVSLHRICDAQLEAEEDDSEEGY